MRQPIDGAAIAAAVKQPDDGAVVVFDGIVRNQTKGRQHACISSTPPTNRWRSSRWSNWLRRRWPTLPSVTSGWFTGSGRLEIGETSVYIAVASAHRAAAFEACRWVIDTLKKTVPIWKKEFFADGAVWADGEPFPPEVPVARRRVKVARFGLE